MLARNPELSPFDTNCENLEVVVRTFKDLH